MTTATEEAAQTQADLPDQASQLPEPKGFKLLIALPEIKETTEHGIFRGDEEVHIERVISMVGFVLKVGPDAYKDEKRFPSGAYCKEGDWILFRSYSGTRIKIHGKEFRLINDDTVEAVVRDPSGITKA